MAADRERVKNFGKSEARRPEQAKRFRQRTAGNSWRFIPVYPMNIINEVLAKRTIP